MPVEIKISLQYIFAIHSEVLLSYIFEKNMEYLKINH